MRGITKLLIGAAALAALAGGAFWYLTEPVRLSGPALASLGPGDPARGERVFWAGGCASCHAGLQASGEERLLLAGGERLETEFGTFVAPNISPHPTDGIGGWSLEDFANAMLRGVSPDGRHYYPAFPYASYTRMTAADISDLHAFMQTLPPVEGGAPANELSFPYSFRRGVGLWKLLHLDSRPAVALAGASEEVLRGQYLVEGPGHCGECHTPRNVLGAMDTGRWLAGAPAPTGGRGNPNITPGEGGIGDWADYEIADYLETGFTPDFDSAGGRMAAVVRNLAELPAEDREAIAAYLKAIPAHSSAR